MSFGIEHEGPIRIIAFFGIALMMALWEWRRPFRQPNEGQATRRLHHFLLTLFNSISLRLGLPILAIGVAQLAQENTWGVFWHFPMPFWVQLTLGVLLLDLLIYWQHRVFHRVDLLWRLHRVHHSDLDYDFTTALRFHPIEIFLSMIIKMAAIVALGVPPLGVLLFEVILNGLAMFNHGNVSLGKKLDPLFRSVIVTPDMHRIHHSVIPEECHSNFGFNLTWWDKLFGSYHGAHRGTLEIGMQEFRGPEWSRFFGLLRMPFSDKS